MKNLASCKPTEFFKQTNRIKKSVEKWLTDTDILNIRKNVAAPSKITDDMDEEQKREAVKDYKKRTEEQARKNLSAILDAIFDKHPDETLELLALLCFVEPENVDDHPMSEYFNCVAEMLGDESVVGFFTSLARWGVKAT